MTLTRLSPIAHRLPMRNNAFAASLYIIVALVTHPPADLVPDIHLPLSSIGVALAALMLFGWSVLPGIAVAILLTGLWVGWGDAAAVCLATIGGIGCGHMLMKRLNLTSNGLTTLDSLAAFFFAGVVVTSSLSTSIVTAIHLLGPTAIKDLASAALFHSWLSDILSVLLITPVLLSTYGALQEERQPGLNIEALFLIGVQCVITAFAFGPLAANPVAQVVYLLPIGTLLALRHRLFFTACANLLSFWVAGIALSIEAAILQSTPLLTVHLHLMVLFGVLLAVSVLSHQRNVALASARENDTRYRSMTELFDDWYWEMDDIGQFTLVSQGASGGTGIPVNEHIGRQPWGLYGAGQENRGWIELRKHIELRVPFDLAFERRSADGTYRHFALVGRPVFDEQHMFTGYRGIGRDTSRQVAQQARLQESRQFLDDVLNAIDSPIVVKDDAHRFILLNDAAVEFLGRPRERLIGNTDFDIFPVEQAVYFQETDTIALRTRTVVEYERPYTRNGNTHTMYVRKSPVNLGRGEYALVMVLTDVTERHAAEEALRASEERFRSLTALSADWYWEQDESLRFKYFSSSDSHDGAARPNMAEAEMLGKTRFELPVLWASDNDKAAHMETLLRREPFRDLVLGNYEDRFTLVNGEPVFDKHGHFQGYRGTGRDITEIKRAHQAAEASRQFLVDIINKVPSSISVKDRSGRYLEVNNIFCRFVNRSRQDILGHTDEDIFQPALVQTIRDMDLQAVSSGKSVSYELSQGEGVAWRWFLVRTNVLVRPGDSPVIVSVITDLTEHKRIENALRESELRFRDFAQAAGEHLWETDYNRVFTFVSAHVSPLLGYAPEEMIGKPTSAFMPPGEAERVLAWQLVNAKPDGSFRNLEHRVLNREGEIVWLSTNAVPLRDERGAHLGYRGTSADITARKSDEERIRHLATRDALTELPNRILLNDRLEHAIQAARRSNQIAAMLFIDLDHFKTINDSLGHPVGDVMLKEVASRLKHCVRGDDTVSRFGGDEFVVLIGQLGRAHDAAITAQKILKALSQPYEVQGRVLATSCSIGIVVIPDDGQDLSTLLKNADSAMYHAKEQGRNTYQFFSSDMSQRVLERHDLEMELRSALTRGDFQLHFQPQIDCATGQISCVEALVRWQHPERGLIQPNSFIPVAEDLGLINAIGDWVMNTVCEQLKAWERECKRLPRIAINISARQIFDPFRFAESIEAQLHEAGLGGQMIELEMTESTLLKNASENALMLHRLRQFGLSVAVDDFGTGYSSLAYLKQLPIQTLKIDRSFVHDVETNPQDLAIVKAIIAMAHTLNLQVVAEGVETKGQAEIMTALGCTALQGYYFAQPMPAEEFFERYLRPGPARIRRVQPVEIVTSQAVSSLTQARQA